MPLGLALPLALAVLLGVLGGQLAAPGSAELLALACLAALAGRRPRLALGLLATALVAGQLLTLRGGELAPA